MTRDEWLSQFEDELKKLRPHVGQRLRRHIGATDVQPEGTPAGPGAPVRQEPAATRACTGQEAREVTAAGRCRPVVGECWASVWPKDAVRAVGTISIWSVTGSAGSRIAAVADDPHDLVPCVARCVADCNRDFGQIKVHCVRRRLAACDGVKSTGRNEAGH